MSYAPFPSNDGSDQQDPARVTGLRLRDAQQIAADRLDGGGDGSLKDALADVIANGTPRDDIKRLIDRIGAAPGSRKPRRRGGTVASYLFTRPAKSGFAWSGWRWTRLTS